MRSLHLFMGNRKSTLRGGETTYALPQPAAETHNAAPASESPTPTGSVDSGKRVTVADVRAALPAATMPKLKAVPNSDAGYTKWYARSRDRTSGEFEREEERPAKPIYKAPSSDKVDYSKGRAKGPLYWDGEYDSTELERRSRAVTRHFPDALGVDDYMIRTEILLAGFGFSSTNTIAMCNLCRDEITRDVRWHVENTFGSSFNTTGLGGVLTTGVTGIGAGLSHAPMKASGGEKERVVFFSFPHIAIDGDGSVGIVHRPWRCKPSHACGALEAALGHFKACNHDDHNKTSSLAWTTVDDNGKAIGMVDEMDPEFSFLKRRLTMGMQREGVVGEKLQQTDLVGFTKLAERQITRDLEDLIKAAVDPNKYDYAVCTGVQIHQWSPTGPRLDYISTGSMYAVVNGERIDLDVVSVPPLPPRLIRLVVSGDGKDDDAAGVGGAL